MAGSSGVSGSIGIGKIPSSSVSDGEGVADRLTQVSSDELFQDADQWTMGDGVTQGENGLVVAADVSAPIAEQVINDLIAGLSVEVTTVVTVTTAGDGFTPSVGGTAGTTITTTGTHTEIIETGSDATLNLDRAGAGTFEGTITSLSAKLVL